MCMRVSVSMGVCMCVNVCMCVMECVSVCECVCVSLNTEDRERREQGGRGKIHQTVNEGSSSLSLSPKTAKSERREGSWDWDSGGHSHHSGGKCSRQDPGSFSRRHRDRETLD